MYSHHSHSGQYVAHGVDPLDDIINQAIKMNFDTYCLTEHMPRVNNQFLYPEEITTNSQEDLHVLHYKFIQYLEHAAKIKKESELSDCRTKFVIGTEIEGCDKEHIRYGKQIMEEYKHILKFAVGSVHHVDGIPIDFDQEKWNLALSKSDNNLKTFIEKYYDLQYEMLAVVRPIIVGHFDLFKLYLPSDLKVDLSTGVVDPNGIEVSKISLIKTWVSIESKIIRNLRLINDYGGAIEINTSALRKGLKEPYPGRELCMYVHKYCKSRFVLSDDAHAISHVGVCYKEALEYMINVIKLNELYYIAERPNGSIHLLSKPMSEISADLFWNQLT